jgi:hypothetical protein
MQSPKLSGELLVWTGSPVALAEPDLRSIGPANEQLVGRGDLAGGEATPAPPVRMGAVRGRQRLLFLAIGFAAIAVSAAIGIEQALTPAPPPAGKIAPAIAPAAAKAPSSSAAAAAPAASVPLPPAPAAAKLASDALNPALRPPPIEPTAIASPPSGGGGGGNGAGRSARPEMAAPANATAAAAAAATATPSTKPTASAAAVAAVIGGNSPAIATKAPASLAAPAPTRAPPIAAAGAEWRARGDALFAAGDLAPARQFYELAANAGDGQAALQLGETYDPAFLAQAKIRGSSGRGNRASAAYWYQRASRIGAPGAEILLKAVMASGDERRPHQASE